MRRRSERALALLRRGDLGVSEVRFAVGCWSLGTFTELVGVPQRLSASPDGRDDGDAVVRRATRDQTEQESLELR
jgi:hypothetical protein